VKFFAPPIRISVVSTNLNGARTVEKCIKSVMTQTLQPLEFIIVDAGSNDDSIEVIQKYEKSGVRLIIKTGCSTSEGEFLAEQEAKGDFIAITNTDCYPAPDWLERSYSWILKGYHVVGGVKINSGDAYNFAWTAYPDNKPWETERPALGLTSMSTFTSKQLLMELPLENILESRDVELALIMKRKGLKLVIDPLIRVIHDDPLKNAHASFRKSASYSTRHIHILQRMRGKVEFGGTTGISFSFRRMLSDLLLIDAVKTSVLYRPIIERTGLKVGPLKFVALRAIFNLGQVFGIIRGFLSQPLVPKFNNSRIPTISIMIPTLNEAKYIRKTLESISKQTTEPLETICVDGGSTDGTTDIIKEFMRRPAHASLIVGGKSEPDARNIGAHASKSDFVLFLSADVILRPNTIELLGKDLASNKQLIGITGVPIPFESNAMLRLEYHTWNVLKTLFSRLPTPLRTFVTSSSFLIVRKTEFLSIGGFDSNNVNADGAIGMAFIRMGDTLFDTKISYLLSGRRYNKSGFWGFNQTFSYNILEDFVPIISKIQWFEDFKTRILRMHKPVR
jgi:glycosyltransferase involved in cell wall biosynthesis